MNGAMNETVKKALQLLFDFELEDYEYIEVTVDNKIAAHVKNYQQLQKVISEDTARTANISVCQNTRKLANKSNSIVKRTTAKEILRQSVIILDVDAKENCVISELQARELIEEVVERIKKIDKRIASAVFVAAYTGGGGQIWIKLSRVLERDEIMQLYDALRSKLSVIEEIDKMSFAESQTQRLIGTINQKYGVQTKFLTIYESYTPLDVDLFINQYHSEKAKANETIKELKALDNKYKHELKVLKKRITNIHDVVSELKRIADFADFINVEDKGNYYTALCPFHQERNPSFFIYKNENGQLAVDAHVNKKYDIISFYCDYKKVDFLTAVIELAKFYGVELKEKEKENLSDSLSSLSFEDKEKYIKIFETAKKIKNNLYFNEDENVIIITKKDDYIFFKIKNIPGCIKSVLEYVKKTCWENLHLNPEMRLQIIDAIANVCKNSYFVTCINNNKYKLSINDFLAVHGIEVDEDIDELVEEYNSDFAKYISLCYNHICKQYCSNCSLKNVYKEIFVKEAVTEKGVFTDIKIQIDNEIYSWSGNIIRTQKQLQRRLELIDASLGSRKTAFYIWQTLEKNAIKIDSIQQLIELYSTYFFSYLDTADFNDILLITETRIVDNDLSKSYIFFKERDFRKLIRECVDISRKITKEEYDAIRDAVGIRKKNRINGKTPDWCIRIPFEKLKENAQLFYQKVLLHILEKEKLTDGKTELYELIKNELKEMQYGDDGDDEEEMIIDDGTIIDKVNDYDIVETNHTIPNQGEPIFTDDLDIVDF